MTTTVRDRKFEEFSKATTISKRDVCWTCIFRFTRENKYHHINVAEFKKSEQVVFFYISVLSKYDCSDKTILYRFLEFCFRWFFYACQCDDKPLELLYMSSIMKPLKILLSSMPLSRMNLKAFPICASSVPFMLILCKYGIHVDRSVFDITNTRKILTDFLLYVQENSTIIYSIPELQQLANRILQDYMDEGSENLCCVRSRGTRYIFLIIKTLQAMNLSFVGSHLAFTHIRHLKVLYRTIPDPFVSQEDMKEFLRIIWATAHFQPDYQTVMENVYDHIFENKWPRVYSPRPLKHLCRISLRHILRKKIIILPNSVRKLDVPRDLHSYLFCAEP